MSNEEKKEVGRPRLNIEQHQLEALCRLNPTLKDAAAYFKCSEDTIDNRAKEFGYDNFSDLRNKNMVHTRLSLIRTAVKQAENGNTPMLIFSLKNLCGWADKQEVEQKSKVEITIDDDESKL